MQSNPHKSNCAWIYSVILHVVLFVATALLWTQSSPTGIVASETARDVGIVIAQTPNTSATEYFQESDLPKTTDDQQNNQEANNVGSSAAAANAIPELELPDINLPGMAKLKAPVASGDIENALSPSQLAGGVLGNQPSDATIAAAQARLPQFSGPSGPSLQVSLFGSAPAVGHEFVFVIDRSKSMGGQGLNAMAAAQQQLITTLQGFDKQHHHFNIIAYHHRPTYFKKGNMLAESTPAVLQTISPFFDGLAAFGGTDHEMGLLAALRFKPDVIFLLTDGGDPGLNRAQIGDLTRHCGSRTTVHAIQFGFGPLQEETNFMIKIAEATDGNFHYVDMREYKDTQ
ncbi:MAG: VWA domain-containing protein [Planctomycetaceae bacterium]|jgi:hypothetical protein|nr:VWA domain-containing protein [Planctomycetaceae bacterium]MBT7256657.1 VWA domain-containing protein [Planctomycetaceae bacterium]